MQAAPLPFDIPAATLCWSGLEPHRISLAHFLQRRCRNPHEVEDVVQETLLRAARYRGSLADDRRLEPWLRTIASNVLTDRRRRAVRRREGSEDEAELIEMPALVPDPSEGIDEDEELWIGGEPFAKDRLLRLVCGLLRGMSAMDRDVLHAFYAGDGTCRAASAQLGIGPGVVKVRLYRARLRLRRRCYEALFGEAGAGVPTAVREAAA